MTSLVHRAAAVAGLALGASAAHAAEPFAPPQYFRAGRGLSMDGAPLPSDFAAPGQMAWRTPAPPGHSSPLVAAGRIFVTGFAVDNRELEIDAFDAGRGTLLWRRAIKPEKVESTHPIGSPATSTPACDGQRVFAFFGSRGLLCYDLEGRLLWEKPLGPFQDEYGAGSSPLVVDGKVLLLEDHDVGSFVMAVDAVSGRELWKTPRPDAVRSYSTPAIWTHNGRLELLAAGSLKLTAYDVETGRPIWWVNGLARIVIPTPITDGGRIFMASWAPGGDAGRRVTLPDWDTAVARWDKDHNGRLTRTEIDDREVLDRFFRIDLNQDGALDRLEWERHSAVFQKAQNALLAIEPRGEGDLTGTAVRWIHPKGAPYVSTPVVSHGAVWMVKDGGLVTRVDAETGRTTFEERAVGGGSYYSSPVAGDGKVYFAGEQGVVTVAADEPVWRVISSHHFHEKIFATPAVGGGRLYLRTEEALYGFGVPTPAR